MDFIVIKFHYEDVEDVQLFSDINLVIDYIYTCEINELGKDNVDKEIIKKHIETFYSYGGWIVYS